MRSVRFDDDTLRFGYHRVTGTHDNTKGGMATPATNRAILREGPSKTRIVCRASACSKRSYRFFPSHRRLLRPRS